MKQAEHCSATALTYFWRLPDGKRCGENFPDRRKGVEFWNSNVSKSWTCFRKYCNSPAATANTKRGTNFVFVLVVGVILCLSNGCLYCLVTFLCVATGNKGKSEKVYAQYESWNLHCVKSNFKFLFPCQQNIHHASILQRNMLRTKRKNKNDLLADNFSVGKTVFP